MKTLSTKIVKKITVAVEKEEFVDEITKQLQEDGYDNFSIRVVYEEYYSAVIEAEKLYIPTRECPQCEEKNSLYVECQSLDCDYFE